MNKDSLVSTYTNGVKLTKLMLTQTHNRTLVLLIIYFIYSNVAFCKKHQSYNHSL